MFSLRGNTDYVILLFGQYHNGRRLAFRWNVIPRTPDNLLRGERYINVENLRNCFDEMVVYKDLKKSNFFNSLSLPSFMRDWILKKFEDEEGNFNTEQVAAFVKKYLPKKEDWNAIKNQVIVENERVKFLAKVSVDIDIKTGGIFQE